MTDFLKALNKLCKWRLVLAGWQLGTRPNNDPECQAVRDHRDQSMVLRVEMTAITRLLLEKKIINHTELEQAVAEEAGYLDKAYEEKFPGIKTTDDGVTMDVRVMNEYGTMRGWRP